MTIVDNLTSTYKRMARVARYRPGAPSDGMGNIVVPIKDLDIKSESREFVTDYMSEENTGTFDIGYANFEDRPTLMLTVEAARAICGGNLTLVARLLRLALEDVEEK